MKFVTLRLFLQLNKRGNGYVCGARGMGQSVQWCVVVVVVLKTRNALLCRIQAIMHAHDRPVGQVTSARLTALLRRSSRHLNVLYLARDRL